MLARVLQRESFYHANLSRERADFSVQLSLYVIPSGAKRSRGIPQNSEPCRQRDVSTSLDMTIPLK